MCIYLTDSDLRKACEYIILLEYFDAVIQGNGVTYFLNGLDFVTNRCIDRVTISLRPSNQPECYVRPRLDNCKVDAAYFALIQYDAVVCGCLCKCSQVKLLGDR